jgi:hypothetical protein
VCVSFRDYGPDRRGVRSEAVDAALCVPPFTSRTFRTQVLETSMANCFGLHALHAFLAVPFLAHKRAVLTRALESNTSEMGAAHKTLAAVKTASYEEFAATLEATARAEIAAREAARYAEAEAAQRAAMAEREKWRWLTGDPPPQAPIPGGGIGAGGAAAAPPMSMAPVVQPGALRGECVRACACVCTFGLRRTCAARMRRWWRVCHCASRRAPPRSDASRLRARRAGRRSRRARHVLHWHRPVPFGRLRRLISLRG